MIAAGCFLDILIYNISALFFFNKSENRKKIYVQALLMLFFCLIAFWCGDYFHYEDIFYEASAKGGKSDELEGIYRYIVLASLRNYFLFRLIVWGSALGIYCKILQRFSQLSVFNLAIFSVCSLVMFSYARVYLAAAIFSLGLVYIYKNKNRKELLLGFLLLFSSVLFHRSLAVVIAIFFVSRFIKYNNLYFVIGIFLAFCLKGYIADFLLLPVDYVDEVSDDTSWVLKLQRKINFYIHSEDAYDPECTLSYILYLLSNIVPILYLYFVIMKHKLIDVGDKIIKALVNIYCYLCLLATMLFILDLGPGCIYYRFFYLTHLFFSMLITYFLQENICRKNMLTTVVLCWFGWNYVLLYAFYCGVVN